VRIRFRVLLALVVAPSERSRRAGARSSRAPSIEDDRRRSFSAWAKSGRARGLAPNADGPFSMNSEAKERRTARQASPGQGAGEEASSRSWAPGGGGRPGGSRVTRRCTFRVLEEVDDPTSSSSASSRGDVLERSGAARKLVAIGPQKRTRKVSDDRRSPNARAAISRNRPRGGSVGRSRLEQRGQERFGPGRVRIAFTSTCLDQQVRKLVVLRERRMNGLELRRRRSLHRDLDRAAELALDLVRRASLTDVTT